MSTIERKQKQLDDLNIEKERLMKKQVELRYRIHEHQVEIKKAQKELDEIANNRPTNGKLLQCLLEIEDLQYYINYADNPKPVWRGTVSCFMEDYVIRRVTEERIYLTDPNSPCSNEIYSKIDHGDHGLNIQATLNVWRKFQEQ